MWVRSLAETPLRPTAAALQRLRPQQFTEEFVRDNGKLWYLISKYIIFHVLDNFQSVLLNLSDQRLSNTIYLMTLGSSVSSHLYNRLSIKADCKDKHNYKICP